MSENRSSDISGGQTERADGNYPHIKCYGMGDFFVDVVDILVKEVTSYITEELITFTNKFSNSRFYAEVLKNLNLS
jgi:hypothetical protein